MKAAKRAKAETPAARLAPIPPPKRTPGWWYALGGFAALFVLFEIYEPAIHAPFVFDDRYLPFFNAGRAGIRLRDWITGVRPALMLTYWINYEASGLEPYSYKVLNALFHFADRILL